MTLLKCPTRFSSVLHDAAEIHRQSAVAADQQKHLQKFENRISTLAGYSPNISTFPEAESPARVLHDSSNLPECQSLTTPKVIVSLLVCPISGNACVASGISQESNQS